MITTATPSMIPTLKSLWIEAFKDSEAYVDFFFRHRFEEVSTFVYIIGDVPVSMAFVFDEELYHKGSYVNAGYIYGVATATEHQGKGYSTEVLQHIHSIYPTTFLIPANQRLFDFYGRNGYETAFVVHEETLLTTNHRSLVRENSFVSSSQSVFLTPKQPHPHSVELSNIIYSFEPLSPEVYKTIRDRVFQKEGYIRWSEASIAYAIAENQFCGGQALKVSVLEHHLDELQTKYNHEDILLCRCVENQLYIKETTLSGQNLYDVALLLMKENKVAKCHLRLLADSANAGRGFGMLHSSFHVENGYCNLVLD